jgi:hypothetical protein
MKAVLHLAVFLLLAVAACSFAFAQDTVYVFQVYAPAPDAYTQPAAENNAPTSTTIIAEKQTNAPKTVPQKNKERRRSSFYLNSGIGFDYSYIYYDHRYYDEKTEFDGNAVGFISELTMGMLIREFLAIHGTIEFSRFDGEYDLIHREHSQRWGGSYASYSNPDYYDEDIDGTLFLFGPGVTFFPFSHRDNFMRWAYVDAKLLMGIIVLNNSLDSYYYSRSRRDNYFAMAGELEIGKDWKVSDRSYIGIGIKWQVLAIASGDDMEGEEDYDDYYHHTHVMNSLQLLLRFNRK